MHAQEKNTESTLFGLPIFKNISPSAFIWTSVSLLVLLALFVFFASPTFKGFISQNQLTLTVPHEGSHIFLDTEQVAVTTQDNETVTLRNITDGIHVVMVAKNDYWTWAQAIDFTLKNTYEAHAFLVQRNTEKEQIPATSTIHTTVQPLITSPNRVPTNESRHSSFDNMTQMWIEDGTAFIEWVATSTPISDAFCAQERCQNPKSISPGTQVRNAVFYPNRNDVILVESQNHIIAIGAESQSHQIALEAPVGSSPFIHATSNEDIFVLSEGDLYRLTF